MIVQVEGGICGLTTLICFSKSQTLQYLINAKAFEALFKVSNSFSHPKKFGAVETGAQYLFGGGRRLPLRLPVLVIAEQNANLIGRSCHFCTKQISKHFLSVPFQIVYNLKSPLLRRLYKFRELLILILL